MENGYKILHPREIASAINKNKVSIKTLSVETYLSRSSEEPRPESNQNGIIQDPLKMFADYSTYHFTVIEKPVSNGKATFARANLPIRELAKIDRRTQAATTILMESEMKSIRTGASNSIAYTQLIRIGKMKGKTPAQILIENPDSRADLESTANWLYDRMDNNGNKAQYQAIQNALELFDSGELQSGVPEQDNQMPVTIYKADYRPLESTLREDGSIMVYALNIRCYPGKDMPYEITVKNYWQKYNGRKPIANTATDNISNTIYCTEAEWDDIVEAMKRIRNVLVQCCGEYEYSRAMKAEAENIEQFNRQKNIG